MSKKDLLLNAIEEMLSGNINEIWGICENLGFSYTKKEVNSMFDQEFSYQDFRISL